MIRPPRAALAALLLVLAATAGALAAQGGSRRSTVPAPGLRAGQLPAGLTRTPAPHIRLADARGGTVDTAQLRGRPYAVTFLYTRCPDVCPLIGEELRTALQRLGGAAAQVAVLGVSVDPRYDTAQAARRWIARHRLPASFHYLIGPARRLQPVWRGYFAQPEITGHPETSSHTATIWLVDRHGRRRAGYPAGAPLNPADLAHDFRVLLHES
jgi:protein SCO1/2